MLTVVVSGIILGALYAIAGLGLVVVYRTTRVLNFAMGGMGALASYVALDLLGHHVSYALAIVISVVAGGVLGLLVELLVGRPLRRRPPITVALGTLGALLIFEGIIGAWYGETTFSLPVALGNVKGFHIGSFTLTGNDLLILGLAIAATLLLGLLFAKTRIGLAMRAVSSGPQTAELMGVNVTRTRQTAWVIGGAYGALGALLVTPTSYLTPFSFTTFLLTAFAAVVLGGFTSLNGVVIGAIVFGVAINLADTYLPGGLSSTYTFVGVALILVFRPNGVFGRREHDVPEPDVSSRAQPPAAVVAAAALSSSGPSARPASAPPRNSRFRLAPKWYGWAALLVIFALLPSVVSGSTTILMGTMLASFIAVVGLNIITGYAGQVSLGHAGFMTLGAYATAIISVHTGLPVLLGIFLALIFGGIAGVIIGMPATRLSGIYLALLTLVFTFAVPELIEQLGSFTGGPDGLPETLPNFLLSNNAQYWFVLSIAAVVAVLALALSASRIGRGWRAVRDSEDGARSLGLNPTAIKLGAFALSSALAALGGALTGALSGYISTQTFGVFQSIYILLAVVVGGSGSIFGCLLGAMFITLIPAYLPTSIPPDIVFGVAMIITLVVAPDGLAGLLQRISLRLNLSLRSSLARTRGPVTVAAGDTSASAASPVPGVAEEPVAAVAIQPAAMQRNGHAPEPSRSLNGAARSNSPLLELHGVTAGYGLTTVLHDVSIHVNPGEVVTVIGANGAGKSTLLRAISQVVPRSAGSIIWRGSELGGTLHKSPHHVTRLGISHVPEGRAVFPDLTVEENLRMGTFGVGSRADPGREHEIAQDVIFDHFPRLRERRNQRAGTLSGGEQQMLAIGRGLVANPDLLLLDEPSLGLAPVIVQQVFEIVKDIAASGVAILLVEQNAFAALGLADHGYLMSGGRIVHEGSGAELRNDDRIAQTYFAGETA